MHLHTFEALVPHLCRFAASSLNLAAAHTLPDRNRCQVIKCALCDLVFHRIDKKKHYDSCKGLPKDDHRRPAAQDRRGSGGGNDGGRRPAAGSRVSAQPRSRAADADAAVGSPRPGFWPGDSACLTDWPEREGRVLFCGVIKGLWVLGVELRVKRASSLCDGEHDGRRYFRCEPGYGLLSPASDFQRVRSSVRREEGKAESSSRDAAAAKAVDKFEHFNELNRDFETYSIKRHIWL